METLLSRAEIPIIDLGHVDGQDPPESSALLRVAAQLHRSFSSKGLALLMNHGIANDKLQAVYTALDKFCALPAEIRGCYLRAPPHNHGYVPPGAERFTPGRLEEVRHTFNIAWLDRKLPEKEIPGFQAAVSALAQEFHTLALLLLQALAVGLDLPQNFFLTKHQAILKKGNESCMRLLYYPPFDRPPSIGTTRCGEHADYGTFTLLAQDSEGGLEIKTGRRSWGRVGHLPGAVLINTGDLLAAWTGGKYPALRHRVVVPEQAQVRARGRHSVAFFVHPEDDIPIIPLQSSVLDEQAAPLPNNNAATNKDNKIYTAYQHVQMRFQQSYI